MTTPLSLKPDHWPEVDRRLWLAAQQPPKFLEAAKPASQWSPKRRRIVEQAYGQWLSWLFRNDRLDPGVDPGNRVNPELVNRFLAELAERVASQSVSMMLGGFQRMLQVLDTERDWDWLRRLYAQSKAVAKSERNKTAHAVAPGQLFELGLQLMESPSLWKRSPGYYRSTSYRDGLMIAILISCPVRVSNLEHIEIGRHLLFDQGHYWLNFADEETKTGRAFQGDLPGVLTPYIERYLDFHRPALRARSKSSSETRRLWLDRWGQPMAEPAIRAQINKRTMEAFGRNVWPHLFRHCAATGLVDAAPDDIAIAPDLLGHATMRTTEKYYILARGTQAHAAVHRTISQARQEARSRFRCRRCN